MGLKPICQCVQCSPFDWCSLSVCADRSVRSVGFGVAFCWKFRWHCWRSRSCIQRGTLTFALNLNPNNPKFSRQHTWSWNTVRQRNVLVRKTTPNQLKLLPIQAHKWFTYDPNNNMVNINIWVNVCSTHKLYREANMQAKCKMSRVRLHAVRNGLTANRTYELYMFVRFAGWMNFKLSLLSPSLFSGHKPRSS